ncbi:MAG: beta-lactamase family protein [Rhodothermales bacterium]|nr:beta-lactamase family protein [Rhodothermales bacterium]
MFLKRHALLFLVLLASSVNTGRAQQASEDGDNIGSLAGLDWPALADSVLGQAVANGQVPGATVIVVGRDSIVFEALFGIANLESEDAVTDSTLFEVGSIGKVLTAIAVLQQVEQGRLDLHADVNSILPGWKIESAAASPVTLHHLLTHSAGLNDRAIGYATREAASMQPLDEHLAAHFPTPFAPPGRYVSYSNYGYGLAGYLVETVADEPFADYVSQEILLPLSVTHSGYSPRVRGPKAMGYLVDGDDFRPAPQVHRPVTPAGSFAASTRDMARILQALLNEGDPVLSSESVRMMTEIRHTQHEYLMGNSYGLEESRWGDVRGFGKGGSIPGFASYMAVIPEQGFGLFVAVNVGADDAIDRFVTAALGGRSVEPSSLASSFAIDVSLYEGEYRSNRYDRRSIEKLLRMEIHDIYAAADGSLSLWHDGGMNRYRPVDGLVFQNVQDANRYLVFEKDERGDIKHAFFNERFAGGYVPVAWERNGFWNSNRYVNEYFGIVVLVAISYLVLPFVALFGALRRRLKADGRRSSVSRGWHHIAGFLTSAVVLVCVIFYFIPLLKARPELVFGVPSELAPWGILPWFVIVAFGAFGALWFYAVNRARINKIGLAFGVVFLASGVLLGEFFVRWNLI